MKECRGYCTVNRNLKSDHLELTKQDKVPVDDGKNYRNKSKMRVNSRDYYGKINVKH